MKSEIQGKKFLVGVFCAALLVGCKKPSEQAAKDSEEQVVAEQTITQEHKEEEHMHKHGSHDGGHHHHAFNEPEKYAERWNDPERDSWQHPEEIVAAMGITPGAKVADIGAGTGYMVAHLSKAVGEAGEVQAIDVEEAMVKYIASKKDELGPATILPRKVSMESPALKPATMDAVMTLNTWHHIGGREAYAAKVFDGLKVGGKFVIVDFIKDQALEQGPPMEMRLTADEIVKELESAGFAVEVVTESMPRHYMVVGTKK